MELENTNAAMQPDSPEVSLSEPHFNDEATLLSARPVVPLDEVELADEAEQSTSRFPRGWILAATVFGAMLLGALASAVYLSIANREAADSFIESEALTSGVVGEVSEPARSVQTAGAAANAQVTPDADQVNAEQPQEAQPAEPDHDVKKPSARRVDVLTYRTTREDRKAERRLAKEQKRELERQNRRARDLTRIREIFEGQRP